MNGVPEDLAEAVHRAARTAPPHAADLAAVRRRARARRRRRNTAAVGGLAVLVALTGGAVPLLARNPAAPVGTTAGTPTAPVTASPPTPTRPPEPAQRLMITDQSGSRGPGAERRGGLVEEVLPDGSARQHRVPEGFTLGAALPDGRLVGLVYTDLTPDVERPDGPDVEGLSIRLVVLGPSGAVERSREVRIKGQGVELLGADERFAYLARDGGVVTHDLVTGRERMLLRSSTAGVDLLGASKTDVRPDLLVEQRDDHGCHTDVRRTTDGTRVTRLTVGGLCVNGLRLSPDGSLVAVPYRLLATSRNSREQRLAVFDTATGTLRADQLIADPAFAPGPITGVAWADAATVRVAWAALPVSLGRDASVDDLVQKVATVSVQ